MTHDPLAKQYLPHTLHIGRTAIQVCDLADASCAYQNRRDDSRKGAATFPDGRVCIDGTQYRISYNGRVWNGAAIVLEAQ